MEDVKDLMVACHVCRAIVFVRKNAAVGESSTSDLAKALSLDNSSGSLKRALRIFEFDGIIAYIIPEKPRSRL